ncbi:MAG: hypothetical protein HRF40_04510 [Nitrososphaera sp.]|jgi:hypothetical protein
MTRESRQQLVAPELSAEMEDHDHHGMSCPDCDSPLEQSYDYFDNCRYFCDNCNMLVQGTNAISWDDESE